MTTWNNQGGQYPPPPPGQPYYGQPGYPPQQPYPGAGYPPPGGYPPPQGYPGQQPYPPGPGGNVGFVPGPPPGGDPYNQPGMYGGQDPFPPEEMKGFDFSDATIRRGFIRKVYSILMIQLTVTFGFICFFIYNESAQNFVFRHPELFIIALIAFLVTFIALVCCENVRRKAPMNFIFLGIFTLTESLFLAATSVRYETEEVMMAVGLTAAVCLGLMVFAMQTKYDFTVFSGSLFVALLLLMLFGIVAAIIRTKIMALLYSTFGALLFCVYLIYDTQMIMGGQHKYSVSPEEYIFAALCLYLDIIRIFMEILRIIGYLRGE